MGHYNVGVPFEKNAVDIVGPYPVFDKGKDCHTNLLMFLMGNRIPFNERTGYETIFL